MTGSGSSSQGPVLTKSTDGAPFVSTDPGPRTLILLVLFLTLSGCGYTIGSTGGSIGGTSSPHAEAGRLSRTIAVPIFDNTTSDPLLGEIVTERVKAQLLATGSWQMANTDQRPELLLNGHVSTLKLTPVAFDANSLATEYRLELHVEVTLTRAADSSTIWSAPDLVSLADYYVDQNNLAASNESMNRAVRDAGQRLAENIVEQLALLSNTSPEASDTTGGKESGIGDVPPATPRITAPTVTPTIPSTAPQAIPKTTPKTAPKTAQ
jgi:outer membrane lipopolysaccharide assembly protein LptE/RlpB